MSNNASTVKPASLLGAVYVGPVNEATLPTDASTKMSTLSAFKSVGYISEDGITNAYSIDSEDTKCWGGVTVDSTVTGKTDNWQFKMISAKNAEALKIVYGDANVIMQGDKVKEVKAAGGEPEAHSFVIDTIIDGEAARICIANGKLSEIGDMVYKSDEVLGYEVTISALADANDVTHHKYFV